MSEVAELAATVAGWARDGEQVEVYVARSSGTSVRAYGGEVESMSQATSAGIGVRVLRDGRQCRLDALLADLLRDPADPAAEEAGGVGAVGPRLVPAADHVPQLGQERHRGRRPTLRVAGDERAGAEAGRVAGVAGGPGRYGVQQQRVAVAVDLDRPHRQRVPAGLPLVHWPPRLREKKVASPVDSVATVNTPSSTAAICRTEGVQPKNSDIATTTTICGTVFTAATSMLETGNISRGR